MAKSASTVSHEFKTRLRSLEYTQKKVGVLFAKGLITRRDLEQIHQGLFLEAVAAFERFLEDLFLGLLTRQVNPNSSRTSPRVFLGSRVIAMPVVFNGPYYDWLPYDRTLKRAGDFFKDGHPFTILDQNDKNKIDSFLIIRNVIAHKSAFAKKKFENRVIGSSSLPPRERKVGGYLVGNFRSSPPQTRYENLIIEMATIFEKICTS
jgi:hypothetical protein